MEKESGDAGGSDGFFSGAKDNPLCKPVVDHNQQGIEAGG